MLPSLAAKLLRQIVHTALSFILRTKHKILPNTGRGVCHPYLSGNITSTTDIWFIFSLAAHSISIEQPLVAHALHYTSSQ